MAFPIESYAAKIQRKLLKKQRVIEAASGRQKADLVLKNSTYVNVFSNELLTCDIAVANGLIVGLGSYEGEVEYDMTGKIVCPGFVDAHIHLESSLVTPKEFVRATLPHGTTTVITDPHEITNVMGTDGIDYMFQATEGLPIDVRFMLPSCVPATPMDESGANLDYRAIDSFYDYPRVQGLAEMMNSYGVTTMTPRSSRRSSLRRRTTRRSTATHRACRARIWIPTLPPASIPTTSAPRWKTHLQNCSAASLS